MDNIIVNIIYPNFGLPEFDELYNLITSLSNKNIRIVFNTEPIKILDENDIINRLFAIKK